MAHEWKNANEILSPKHVTCLPENSYGLKNFLFFVFFGGGHRRGIEDP
jgi:hypothetical protein